MPAPVKLPPQKKNPNHRGRPCLLTKQREAALMKAIEEGLPLKQSAMLAGVSYDTLNRWRHKGDADDALPEFRNFCNALRRSEAVAMQRHLAIISDAGKKDWKASTWILQRRFREEFGEQKETQESEQKDERRQLFEKVAKLEMHPVQRMIFDNARHKESVFNLWTKFAAQIQKNKAKEEEIRNASMVKEARLRE